MMNHYVAEKLRELEAERLALLQIHELPPRKPAFTAIIRAAGRNLRRTGERLEAWAHAASRRTGTAPLRRSPARALASSATGTGGSVRQQFRMRCGLREPTAREQLLAPV